MSARIVDKIEFARLRAVTRGRKAVNYDYDIRLLRYHSKKKTRLEKAEGNLTWRVLS